MLAAALTALLLVVGLVACGGDDDSGSTIAGAERSTGAGSIDDSDTKDRESQPAESGAANGRSGQSEESDASDFVPKSHQDSGGGSDQYMVKGGDNSVQEFGEEADPSEFEAAATALHNFLDARAEGNWDAACEYMSKSAVESFEQLASQSKQLAGASCGAILEKVTNPAAMPATKAEAAAADVGSLRVEGDRSFLIYTGTKGTVLAMPMANEDGEWKVGGLAGTPLN